MFFVDSSFIIALFNNTDINRYKAVHSFLDEFEYINKAPKAINNIVFNEVLNKLRKSYFRGKEEEIIEFLLNMDSIYFVNNESYEIALDLYRMYDYNINFSDLLIALSMKDNGIKNILSFDRDFFKIKGIINIYIQ